MITMLPARPAKALAPLLLDVPEAATLLRIGRTTMWDLVQTGGSDPAGFVAECSCPWMLYASTSGCCPAGQGTKCQSHKWTE